MQTPYTVPEIARLTGIPETTLYDYVRQFAGIVPEMDPSEESGRTRRRYPEQAIAVFQTIRHLKDRGVDLPTIRALLNEGKRPEDAPRETLEREELRPEAATDAPEPTAQAHSSPGAAQPETVVVSSPASLEATAVGDAWSPSPDQVNGASHSPFFQAPVPIESMGVPAAAGQKPLTVREVVPAEAPADPAPLVEQTGVEALQERLLGSLEEGIHSLRELLDTENVEKNRLLDALKAERQQLEAERERLQKVQHENDELRGLLTSQKDQTRAAERLLSLIKTHCEQGIQTIGD